MGSSKPKPVQAPFQQQQQTTNTFAPHSIANTPEAQQYLNAPLDYGSDTNVDPGVGRRTALAEQESSNRYNSAFNAGVPRFIREMNQAKEQRDIQGQGAYEAQQAEYLNQQGNNARRAMTTNANLARYERLLPQILQTGGSGSASGYNTQIVQPQPGFWQRAALGVIGNAASAGRMAATGGFG